MGTAIEHPVPDQVKPSFVIFWHPGTLTIRAERQSARMSKITNDGLTVGVKELTVVTVAWMAAIVCRVCFAGVGGGPTDEPVKEKRSRRFVGRFVGRRAGRWRCLSGGRVGRRLAEEAGQGGDGTERPAHQTWSSGCRWLRRPAVTCLVAAGRP